MRTIKFRGYNLKNKQWIYGYYLVNRGKHYIVQDEVVEPFKEASDFEVDAESVGQFVTNVDGVDIYEGDIVSVLRPKNEYVVFYNNAQRGFMMSHYDIKPKELNPVFLEQENMSSRKRVIGNEYEQKLKEHYEDTEARS